MLTMKLLIVLVGICCLATCAIALVPSGPSHQQAVIDGPSTFPETNLDDIEYRIHFKEGDTNRNLSCKTRTSFLRSKTNALTETDDTVQLKLQNNDPRPFDWIEVSNQKFDREWEIIRNYRKTGAYFVYNYDPLNPPEYLYLEGLLLAPRTSTGSVYSICKTWLANTSKSIIGMMSWESLTPSCQVVSNGHLMSLSNYTLLANIYNVRFTWVNVTTWRDIPRAADLFHAELPYRSHKSVIDTEKRYIGRLISPGQEPIIIDVPEGKEEIPLPIEGAAVQRQVLVPVDFYNYPIESLICQPATGAFNIRKYREEVFFEAKVAPGQGEEGEKLEATIGEATVFRKIEEKVSLSWQFPRLSGSPAEGVFVGKDGSGNHIYICRSRGGSGGCQKYTSTNGTVLYRSCDKVLGTSYHRMGACTIHTGDSLSMGPSEWLANPLGAKVSWTPVSALSTSNGTVVTSEANGVTYVIGRMYRPGIYRFCGDTVGHVDLSSKTILLSDGSIYTWESGHTKVDILMIHE